MADITSNNTSHSIFFDTDPDTENLSEEDEILLHHNVAKLLFLSKSVRSDIQPIFVFICKRFYKPDQDNKKKLCREMIYLNEKKLLLTLEADGRINAIKRWVDVSYSES